MEDGEQKDAAMFALVELKAKASTFESWNDQSEAMRTLSKFQAPIRGDTVSEMAEKMISALVGLSPKSRAKTISEMNEHLWYDCIMGMPDDARLDTLTAMPVDMRAEWLMKLEVDVRGKEVESLSIKDRVKTLLLFEEPLCIDTIDMVKTMNAMSKDGNLLTLYEMPPETRGLVCLQMDFTNRIKTLTEMTDKCRSGTIMAFPEVEKTDEVMRAFDLKTALATLNFVSPDVRAGLLSRMDDVLKLTCVLGLKPLARAEAFDTQSRADRLEYIMLMNGDVIVERSKTVLELTQTKKRPNQNTVLIGMVPCWPFDPKIAELPERVRTIMAMSKNNRVHSLVNMTEVHRNETLFAMDPKDAKSLLQAIVSSGLLGSDGGSGKYALTLLKMADLSPSDLAAFLLEMKVKERKEVMPQMMPKILGGAISTMTEKNMVMLLGELQPKPRAEVIMAMNEKTRIISFHIMAVMQRIDVLLPEETMPAEDRTLTLTLTLTLIGGDDVR